MASTFRSGFQFEDDPKSREKFDSTKWNLLELDMAQEAQPAVQLMSDILSSPEWNAAFGSRVPELTRLVRESVAEDVKALEQESESRKSTTARAVARVNEQVAAAREIEKARQAPPAVQPVANQYQVSLRLTDPKTHAGVPAVTAQLVAGEKPLAEAVTDTDGNAILAVGAEALRQTAPIGLQVVPPDTQRSKSVPVKADLKPAAGKVDTVVTDIPSPASFPAAVEAGTRLQKERAARVEALKLRTEQLNTAAEESEAGIREQIADLQKLIEEK
jgi:hypothetical protein